MREPRVHRLELHGLTHADSAELLHELLGGRVPAELVSRGLRRLVMRLMGPTPRWIVGRLIPIGF